MSKIDIYSAYLRACRVSNVPSETGLSAGGLRSLEQSLPRKNVCQRPVMKLLGVDALQDGQNLMSRACITRVIERRARR